MSTTEIFKAANLDNAQLEEGLRPLGDARPALMPRLPGRIPLADRKGPACWRGVVSVVRGRESRRRPIRSQVWILLPIPNTLTVSLPSSAHERPDCRPQDT